MSSNVNRAGACLMDAHMRPYNAKSKSYVKVDWKSTDRNFREIEPLLAGKGSKDHIMPEVTPISHQGKAGTCVANAWCDAMEILDGLHGNDVVEQLSRRFLYWCARSYTNDTHKDDGTYLRSAAHQLKNIGIFEEKYFEYSDKEELLTSPNKLASPKLDHYTLASNNRLNGFYRIESSSKSERLSYIERAIRSNHPVVFSILLNKGFQRVSGNTALGPPKIGETLLGSHAMVVIGVGSDGNDRWWLVRNSWGKDWGNKGYIKINDDYMSQYIDAWVGTKMKERLL